MPENDERERKLEAGRKKLERFRAKAKGGKKAVQDPPSAAPTSNTPGHLDAPVASAAQQPDAEHAPSPASSVDVSALSEVSTVEAGGKVKDGGMDAVASAETHVHPLVSESVRGSPFPAEVPTTSAPNEAQESKLERADSGPGAAELSSWLASRDKRMRVIMAAAIEMEHTIATASYSRTSRFTSSESRNIKFHALMRTAHDVVLRLEGSDVAPAEPCDHSEFPAVADVIEELRQRNAAHADINAIGAEEEAPMGVINSSPADPDMTNQQPPNGGPEMPSPGKLPPQSEGAPHVREFGLPTLIDLQEGLSDLRHEQQQQQQQQQHHHQHQQHQQKVSPQAAAGGPEVHQQDDDGSGLIFSSPFERGSDHLSASELRRQALSHNPLAADDHDFASSLEPPPPSAAAVAIAPGGQDGTVRELMFENSALSRRVEAQASALIEMSVDKERWAAERAGVQQREKDAAHKCRLLAEEKQQLTESLQSVIESLLQENNMMRERLEQLDQPFTALSASERGRQKQKQPQSLGAGGSEARGGGGGGSGSAAIRTGGAQGEGESAGKAERAGGGGAGAGAEAPRGETGRKSGVVAVSESVRAERVEVSEVAAVRVSAPPDGQQGGGQRGGEGQAGGGQSAGEGHLGGEDAMAGAGHAGTTIDEESLVETAAEVGVHGGEQLGGGEGRVSSREESLPPAVDATTRGDGAEGAVGLHQAEGEMKAGVGEEVEKGGGEGSGQGLAAEEKRTQEARQEEAEVRELEREGGEEKRGGGALERDSPVGFAALAGALLLEQDSEESAQWRSAEAVQEVGEPGALDKVVTGQAERVGSGSQLGVIPETAEGEGGNKGGRQAPRARPFPAELLAHPGDKDIQIDLRHLGLAPKHKAPTPVLYSLVDTIWGVVSLRPVRSLVFGGGGGEPEDEDEIW